MKFTQTKLAGGCLIEQEQIKDERGFFARQYCAKEFAAHGLPTAFVQTNNSQSAYAGTLRGLHYQLPPYAETKLIRCVRGSLFDVMLDLREDSPTYLQNYGVTLSAVNRLMLCVPKGCAHAFLTLEDDTEALYWVDEYYAAGEEKGLRWDDPVLGIEWPISPVVISDKDTNWPYLEVSRNNAT